MTGVQAPGEKMRNYRARLRASGLRPVQIWVPDVRSPDFVQELQRQVSNLEAVHEAEIMGYFGELLDETGWA